MSKVTRTLKARNIVIFVAAGLTLTSCGRTAETNTSGGSANASQSEPSVELSQNQLSAIKLQPVGSYQFYVEKRGIGNIDFDSKLYFDNNLSVQVFSPRSGKITRTLAELGDEVQQGQPLFTIVTGNQTEIAVPSPITGQVTAVNVSPGLEVEPRKAPPPYAVADVSTKWMVGNVPESDSSFFRVGQPVDVKAMAYPDRTFSGKIIKIYPAVDGTTHRIMIRSEVADPRNELRSGMLAEFAVRVRESTETTAIPTNAAVREGDGTMTAWVTTDRRHFSQTAIRTGLREDDRVQVLEGLDRGQLVVTDNAVFLSNMLQAPPSD